MSQQKKPSHKSSLRKIAEETLSKNPSKAPLQEILHDLAVHQAELEIQNEEIHHTQMKLTDSRDSDEEIYDFAPVGYLTFDSEDRILKTNLTTVKMIGLERSKLTRSKKYSSLVSPQSQDTFSFVFGTVQGD